MNLLAFYSYPPIHSMISSLSISNMIQPPGIGVVIKWIVTCGTSPTMDKNSTVFLILDPSSLLYEEEELSY